MAKQIKTPPETVYGEVEDALLKAAANHTAFVLRPYPAVETDHLAVVITELRERGFVHGSAREPSLTRAGIDAARELLERVS